MATPCDRDDAQVIPLIGDQNYYSSWISVTQEQVDAFAAVTGDNQWIHQIDAECAGSPFGGPIVHGLFLVSRAITLARESGALKDETWVLYGFDKLRFRAPVRIGTRIRCVTTIQGTNELAGRTLVCARFVMEIEGHKIPAFVAECRLLNLSKTLDSHADVSSARFAD